MVTHGMIPYRPNPHNRDHEGAPGLTAARADRTGVHLGRTVIEQTGLDVLVGQCLLIFDLAPPSSDERIVELVFAAESTMGEGPHPQHAGRWPIFVPLSAAHQLRLLPPIAAFLPSVVRQQVSGGAYLGNLGRGAVTR